jgi:uncharacterized membrane protein
MTMVAIYGPIHLRPLHPLHSIFLSFLFPLFLGTLICDLAYRSTFQIQWANFAQWLNAGGLAVGGLALLWALINLFRSHVLSRTRSVAYFVLLLATWLLGLVNAFMHAKDAWAMMPEGLWLSAITTVLALAASWVGFSGLNIHEVE